MAQKITDKNSPELLWKQFIKGNMESFREIYETNYQYLYNFGLQYLSTDEVEDCIQNLFLYILQHRKSIKHVRNVEAYLFISFRNRIIKKNKSKKIVFQQLATNLSIEESTSTKEIFLVELYKFLHKLSPRENEIIQLRFYGNYNNSQIAKSLGLKNQTVRNTLNNAINKLRKSSFQATI